MSSAHASAAKRQSAVSLPSRATDKAKTKRAASRQGSTRIWSSPSRSPSYSPKLVLRARLAQQRIERAPAIQRGDVVEATDRLTIDEDLRHGVGTGFPD